MSTSFNTAQRLEEILVGEETTLRDVLECIDRSGLGFAFVVDAERHLHGLVTDGDLRRALLKGAQLGDGVRRWVNRGCVKATLGVSRDQILELMSYKVHCVPIVDAQDRIVDFAAFEQVYRIPVAEPNLGGRELEYVTDCITSNWISSKGKYVDRFEQEFAEFCGVEHAISTSNGTVALHLALAALDVKPGDEVIVPDLTFIASANAVAYCGAKAVLVDVDPVTWTMDPRAVDAAVTSRTRGIMPVHLYGHPADMDAISAVARAHGLFVLEDCAEALGARHRGRMAGSLGIAGCFSFYGNKTLTTGEGGMVVTNDDALHARARMLRDHGMSLERRYFHPLVGFNYRLTNLQAAVGVAQLERLPEILARKAAIDRLYREGLSGVPGITLPPQASWADPVCWLFSVLVDEAAFGATRDALLAYLEDKQVGCRPLFHPLHTQPPHRDERSFPVSEALARRGLSLPSAVTMPDRVIEYVCELVREHAETRRA